jgi:glycosyltransferase involved in cell wall biosynthesis
MAECLENINLVGAGDVESIVAKIKEISTTPGPSSLRRGTGHIGQLEFPKVFTLENMLEQTEKVYQKIIS